jgi:hypothetical protein
MPRTLVPSAPSLPRSVTKRWLDFIKEVDRRPERDEYESLAPHRYRALEIYQGGGKPGRLFYFTEEFTFRRWIWYDHSPRDWHVLAKYGLPPPSYLATIRQYVTHLGLPLRFVGSLRPKDLCVFAALRAGGPDMVFNPRTAVPVEYLGLDDRWLKLCEKNAKPKVPVDQLVYRMGRLEEEHLDFIIDLLPDLEELIGPRCFDMLMKGWGFPLAAACNPAFYGKAFPNLLRRHLHRARPRSGG